MTTPISRDEFARHLDQLGLPPAGIAQAMHIYDTEPGRVVRSSPRNSSGSYPSPRTQASQQFESRTLEQFFVLQCEFDRSVRWYTTQPALKITWVHAEPDGATFPITIQPDAFLVRDDRVEVVDVMRSAELEDKAAKHPGQYLRDEDGTWHCPAAEAWATERGLSYRLVTEAELDPTTSRNYWLLCRELDVEAPDDGRLAAIDLRVRGEPGVLFSTLVAEGHAPGDLTWMLAHGRLYTDLARHVVDHPEHCPLYPDADVAEVLDADRPASWSIGNGPPSVLEFVPGARFAWGETRAEVVAVGDGKVWLITEAGTTTELRRTGLEAMWRSGSFRAIQPEPDRHRAAASDIALRCYREGGRDGLARAMERLAVLDGYAAAKANPDHPDFVVDAKGKPRFWGHRLSTIRTWLRDQRRVEAITGDRLAGLVPKANPGNRQPKLDDGVLGVIGEVAAELYATPDRRVVRTVISEVRRRCVEAGLRPPHGRSVREHLKRLPAHRTAAARYGTSTAYRLEPHVPVDPDAAPPNGTYPGHVLHVDHTLVDDETVDPVTGDPLGRLFLTRGVDGFSGRECAHRFTYDHPSAVTVLPILVRFAARFDRLPAILVLDLDPAHRSLELRAFCEVYGITIIWRRTRKGRDGWRVERGFGAANSELFHALSGNTQASRNPREMTRDTNPRLRTTWDLVNLDRVYTEWHDARDERFDPTLGSSPREAWDQGLARLGGTRLVRVDDLMRFLAMPYADGVTRRIHPKNGVVVGYLRYESDEFAELPPQARTGEVRVDPDDASRVMVLVEGRTIEARCRAIAHHRVISRVELSLLSQRIKRDQRDGRRLQGDFETKLGALLGRSREWERTRRALQAEAGRRHRAETNGAIAQGTHPDVAEPRSHPAAMAAYWERVWASDVDSESGAPA